MFTPRPHSTSDRVETQMRAPDSAIWIHIIRSSLAWRSSGSNRWCPCDAIRRTTVEDCDRYSRRNTGSSAWGAKPRVASSSTAPLSHSAGVTSPIRSIMAK